MSRRTRGKGLALNADINVVSLIDVMMLLMVIFMITAPMMQGGVDIALPVAEARPLEARSSLVVSIDHAGHSRPTREYGVGPKTDRCQVITVDRSADHLGNHVIGGAESDRAEPEEQQIVRIPPSHCRLQNALHRNNKKH